MYVITCAYGGNVYLLCWWVGDNSDWYFSGPSLYVACSILVFFLPEYILKRKSHERQGIKYIFTL